MKYQLSDAASRYLDNIFDYTAREWGVSQARSYIGSFNAKFAMLQSTPFLGAILETPNGEYRKIRHNYHMVVYRIQGGVLMVVRVLHQSMDIKQHLE